MQKKLIAPLILALLFSACSSKDDAVKGVRTNIFSAGAVKTLQQAPQIDTAKTNNAWTQPNGVPSGDVGAIVLPAAPKQLWRASVGTLQYDNGLGAVAAPVIYNNVVYVLNAQAQVYAIAADSGKQLWQRDLLPEGAEKKAAAGGGIALANNRLVVVTGLGVVSLLNLQDGTVLQSATIERPVRAAPVSDGRIVVIRTADDRVLFYDANNLQLMRADRTPPAVGAGYVSAHAAIGDKVLAVPLASGELLMTGYFANKQQSFVRSLQNKQQGNMRGTFYASVQSPLIDAQNVYATADGGISAAFSIQSAELVWQQSIASVVPLQKAGDALYGVTAAGEVFALRQRDGQIFYTKALSNKNNVKANGLLVSGGTLYISSSDGALYLVNARDGAVLSTVEIAANSLPMAAANGTLFIAGEGRLTAWR